MVSNGIGEDTIAGSVLDALRPRLPPAARITAWPMVGVGAAYAARGISVEGPSNLLPGEGFSTLDARAFWRDLWSGYLGTVWRQLRHGRRLRGHFDYVLGVGDIQPLVAIALARAPAGFIACAKSAHYGGRSAAKGGHDALDRWLMRRFCADVFPRDSLSADGLAAQGIAVRDLGNPMMDGLAVPEGPALLPTGSIGVAVLPGSRSDATDNCRFLLDAVRAFDAMRPAQVEFLFAITAATDVDALRAGATGWQIDPATGLTLRAPNGARARLLQGQFARVLSESTMAVGLAGTANEQAIGLGLPLITTHGSGNQGAAYLRMKMRYFGPSALAVPRDAQAVAQAVAGLLADPARRAAMGAEGRRRMGPPGASAAIAAQILQRLGAA